MSGHEIKATYGIAVMKPSVHTTISGPTAEEVRKMERAVMAKSLRDRIVAAALIALWLALAGTAGHMRNGSGYAPMPIVIPVYRGK